MDEKKILMSAAQPSGTLTIGNYIGAIKNWVALQDEYDCVFSIADLHSLTVFREPKELRANTLELIATYLACGINPEKAILFLQSTVSAHAELTWILNTISYPGELNRMTQYKEKSRSHADNVNMGLMDYPVLMAADILLYGAHLVPVGVDQKQHLELARDLAARFNNKYSPTFVIPEPYIPKAGAKIMSLQEPEKKMSKSDANVNGYISLADDTDTIIRKFKRAVTDSGSEIKASADKPGVTNLLTIYSIFSGKSVSECEKMFEGKGYGDFKLACGELVADKLAPINAEKAKLIKEKTYLDSILLDGRDRADRLARRMLSKVYRKVGLYSPERKD